MRFTHVQIVAIAYELPLEAVATAALEARLAPVYQRLRIPIGQVEQLTGVAERRFWPRGAALDAQAATAARRALADACFDAADIDCVVYAGVCREQAEPATAAAVAQRLGCKPHALVYDVSNACLGMLTAMLDVAAKLELGQIRSALVVACESARDIIDEMSERLLAAPDDRALFNETIATLTGGSGAAAVLLTRGDAPDAPRLLGAAWANDVSRHELCRWGHRKVEGATPARYEQFMRTDAIQVLRHGAALGRRTWAQFLATMRWDAADMARVVPHQIGDAHRREMQASLALAPDQDFATYPYLGNVGSVSVPLTAKIAAERGAIRRGDRVGLLGIGSGLNCMMIGMTW